MKRDLAWDVSRSGETLRIDLSGSDISEEEKEAMVAVTGSFLADEGILTVQVDGPGLRDRPPKGLASAIQELDGLTRRFGTRLLIGPI